ncbi:MAG: nucleotidyltransferase family protein [Candidatus Woesearchaeota archaeon]
MIKKNIKTKIKEHFFTNPSAKLRVREIERTLNVPLPSVIRYCAELTKENILTTINLGTAKFYAANKTHPNYLLQKKLHNLQKIYESNLINYIKIQLSNPCIILFGSYSKGEDMEDSDIDLYLETPSKKNIDLKEFEKTLNRKIQVFKCRKLKEIPNNHLKNNIINGITINKYIEVFE